MIIGITSSIAMGKTTLAKWLRLEGYLVIDADDIAHDIIENNIDIINKIKVQFPTCVKDNIVNRKALGKVVFSDPLQRSILESFIHPEVIKIIKEKVKDKKLIFVVVPLLYEVGLDALMDQVITIYTESDIELERLMKRDNLSLEDAKKRINSQMNIEEKKKKATYTINNSFNLDYTYNQMREILEKIKKRGNQI